MFVCLSFGLLSCLLEDLSIQTELATQNDVLVLASSGTGVMEASVSNLTSPGDKVLVLTAGKFGERYADYLPLRILNVKSFTNHQRQRAFSDEFRKAAAQDFDFLVVPNGGHGAGGAYAQRRLQDFFQRHLQGIDPPNRNATDSGETQATNSTRNGSDEH